MKLLEISTFILALFGAAILFGFYFTMSVSIMPGFDLTDPYAAITANQDIGRATQKSLFFVALLGTPLTILATMFFQRGNSWRRNWLFLGFIGWLAMMVVTILLNVPLNSILDGLEITQDQPDLKQVWESYSIDWQKWNWLRFITSGFSLVCIVLSTRPFSD